MSHTIALSDRTFQLLSFRAEQLKRSPAEVAEEALTQLLSPPHAHIDISGGRALLKDTRIPVSIIVGYIQAGETPETLASVVMPHVSLAVIHDALSYYYDHQEEVDRERAENTEAASQHYLRERLGAEGYQHLTGTTR